MAHRAAVRRRPAAAWRRLLRPRLFPKTVRRPHRGPVGPLAFAQPARLPLRVPAAPISPSERPVMAASSAGRCRCLSWCGWIERSVQGTLSWGRLPIIVSAGGQKPEVVPGVVEIENGGSSGPGDVAWTTFHHERRNRHEKKVHETRQCWQGFQETTAKEAGWGESNRSVGPGSGGTGGNDARLSADFATKMGLKVASLPLEDEVHRRCGSRYERVPERTVTRYGHQRGVAVIAGQKLPIPRPRMRYTRQCGEATWRLTPGSSRPTPCRRPC